MIDLTTIATDGEPDVSYGEIVYPPGSTYGPGIHPTIEVSLVYTGSMTAWLDQARVEVEAGMACLVLPGERSYFAFSTTSDTDHSWVHLWAPGGYPRPLLERLASLPRAIRLSSTLAREMRALLDLGVSRLTTRREIELLLAHRVLYQYAGEAELIEGLGVINSEPVDRALSHIDEHLASSLDLDTIADAAAVSTSHLIRLFHHELSTTPSRYLWARRVERAVEMLEETGLTLGEIAHRCGFTTTHHFSRKVRETTGLTPTMVRQRSRARGAPPPLAVSAPTGRDD